MGRTPSTVSVNGPTNDSRRSSPSVTTSTPARSCSAIASSTARSSIRLNSVRVMAPAATRSRASSSCAGRSMLPTTSARMTWSTVPPPVV